MAGIVFWIIIVIWIVVSVSKNKKPAGKGGQKAAKQPQVVKPVQSQKNRSNQAEAEQINLKNWAESNQKQQELKQRLTKKYNQRPEGEILRRAKASVAEDFDETVSKKPQFTPDRQKEIERKIAEKLAAAEQAETLRAESAEDWLFGQANLLGSVEDLMIKGPNTDLPFQRDFLSEGLDMLNQIQV